jgi:hypothetical protein
MAEKRVLESVIFDVAHGRSEERDVFSGMPGFLAPVLAPCCMPITVPDNWIWTGHASLMPANYQQQPAAPAHYRCPRATASRLLDSAYIHPSTTQICFLNNDCYIHTNRAVDFSQ